MLSNVPWRLIAAAMGLSCVLLLSDFHLGRRALVVHGDYHLMNADWEYSWQRPTGQSAGITPLSGPPGTRITVAGKGFRSFTSVESITLGGSNIFGNRRTGTDANGDFEAVDMVVPGLSPGIHNVVVQVGTGSNETTAVGTFEIIEAEQAAGEAEISQALVPLGGRLAKVFFFDNSAKSWLFYINDPDFTTANTLTELTDGRPYWFQVTESVSVSLNGRQRTFTCVNEGTPQEDCWNIDVW